MPEYFLLLVLIVMPDQVAPLAVMPYPTMAECRKELVTAMKMVRENVPGKMPYVAICAPISVLPSKPAGIRT